MELYKKEEYYRIVGICMEVHNILGSGLSECIYKDALEIEFSNQNISFEREKAYTITYKAVKLPHFYFADFVVDGDIILEVKAVREIIPEHVAQTINYMKLAESEIGILINFSKSLQHKRIIC